MKTKLIVLSLFAIVSAIALNSYSIYAPTDYEPVLLSRDDLKKSISNQEPREIITPGKIYLYSNKIFIVDNYKGIHVFDNTEHTHPKAMGFIYAPGCIDMAIKDDILYLDNAVDLVAINIAAYPEITVADRVSDVFPEPCPPGYDYIPSEYRDKNRPKNTVIVNWVKRNSL